MHTACCGRLATATGVRLRIWCQQSAVVATHPDRIAIIPQLGGSAQTSSSSSISGQQLWVQSLAAVRRSAVGDDPSLAAAATERLAQMQCELAVSNARVSDGQADAQHHLLPTDCTS